ncbi:MAG: thioether cross-link-forming SCIFF peptide maturase, partial [Clostridia bacterium]|nr:thioether cross-link-forming SCIFF peptide maturase [Clostridia bacterium]
MIHVFSYKDKNYIYDVGSGSLHECDKATADYLKAKEEGADIDITYVTDEQIKEILADVEGLKAQGLLFKEEVKSYPMKSNDVKALCIHICHDCNFRCRYCFADDGAYHSK